MKNKNGKTEAGRLYRINNPDADGLWVPEVAENPRTLTQSGEIHYERLYQHETRDEAKALAIAKQIAIEMDEIHKRHRPISKPRSP